MAARARAAAASSDSEDDLATAGAENARAPTKVTKSKSAKPVARRASTGRPTTKRKAAAPKEAGRQALKDRTNEQPQREGTEEVEAFDDEMDVEMEKPQAKRAKTTAARKPAATKAPTGAKRGRPAAVPKTVSPSEPLEMIPETQQEAPEMEDVEESIEIDPEHVPADPAPAVAAARLGPQRIDQQRASANPSVVPLLPRPSGRGPVSLPVAYPPQRERSGSAMAVDRRGGGDPELRRKFADLTKKHDDLHLRYEALEELGKTAAESNFARLQRASEQRTRDAAELIGSLKKELAELRKLFGSASTETTAFQQQIAALTEAQAHGSRERDALREQLQTAQNENKALEAKLAAARQQMASTSAQEAKTASLRAGSVPLLAGASEAQREAKMKENLYSDLTGLIVRNVKRQEGEDVYDCIQTGRNGTLHFHLTIANDSSTPHPKTPSGLSYEESEFAYEPLLDESRDRELLHLLPDYLTEEICFPRQHAQKFYTRILDSMSKRIELEED